VAEGIATITLDRPEKLNAASGQMIEELLEAFDLADADDAVGAIIVTGEGRAFCSGADLTRGDTTFVAARTEGLDPAGGEAVYSQEAAREPGGAIALRIYNLKKPIIAAVNGGCAGMGASLPLPMDVRSPARRRSSVSSMPGAAWSPKSAPPFPAEDCWCRKGARMVLLWAPGRCAGSSA